MEKLPLRHIEAVLGTKGLSLASCQTVICFSHLRWNFVYQRPQHLMSRFAAGNTVIYWEEAETSADESVSLQIRRCEHTGVIVATPLAPEALQGPSREKALAALVSQLLDDHPGELIRWYYTPMMLGFTRHLQASCTVYDCMDELANFRHAPPGLAEHERELLAAADVVFTGGHSLYEAKRDRHHNIHPFPSSVDLDHFAQARLGRLPPPDQAEAPGPRLGFYGVIDERMDLSLLAAMADARPHWSLMMVGPVVKIDPADLPRRPNIHYLGGKTYNELPAYLAGWDVALMPFEINPSTRFISPTKTPEYLAGGKPVVSTPIIDVVRHYGALKAVQIAAGATEFIEACEAALALTQEGGDWLAEADRVLSALSWDETFRRMRTLIARASRGSLAQGAPVAPTTTSAATVRASTRRKPYDYLIVGAGFAGSVLAERLANGLGKTVLLIDRRPHIGGNAYDETNAAGVLMHRYGPHIFHTNADEIVTYLSRFTRWRPYEHRVLASVRDGLLVPIPINRMTLNRLYDLDLTSDEQAEAFFAQRAKPVAKIRTSEDVVVSKVGQDLYETFFRGYTRKQWGVDPSQLDKSVTARVPTRTNLDDRYFTDSFQAMPELGYTRLFEVMLDNPNITVELGVDFAEVSAEQAFDQLIYTGPIDEYFAHRYGPLPYRSLSFHHETLDREWFQTVGTVNYPSESTPYTRISEYKYITGQSHPKTTITYEYPKADGDPYYPIPRAENQALFKRYEALANATSDVHFVGRLATYRYYNMDQVVGQALATYRRIVDRERRTPVSSVAASSVAAE